MMTLALIVGIWTTTCIQTQMTPDGQGYVTESYAIEETGDFTFTREWFRDPYCSDFMGQDQESGQLVLGKMISGIFVGPDTFEADFSSNRGTDRGAIKIGSDYIQVARGVRNTGMRNTMVKIFQYWKE